MASSYSHLNGTDQPKGSITVPPGRAIGGQPIGILVMDAWYPMMPGNVANASTYDFPVMYKVLKGIPAGRVMSGDPELTEIIVAGGKELIEQGARAIVGACGSFANYQQVAAAELDVPVFLSVMLQAPWILQALRPDQKLGIIAASAAALTPHTYKQCGITEPDRLVIAEVINLPEFQVLAQAKGEFDSAKLESETVGLVGDFAARHDDLGALLLQCSDLPPYAWAIQKVAGLPVFDMNNLINWVYQAVVRKPYHGVL